MKKLRLFDSLKFVRAMFVTVVATFAFAVAPAHAATLPAGYTELEYIESTGTQYIDTGVNIGENIQTKVKFGKTTNSFSKFGFVIGGGGHYQGLVTRTSENSYYVSMYSSSQNTVRITIPDNVFEITFNTQGHKVILNNTASYDLVLLSPYEISNTIGIFRTPGGSSTNNNGIGKVYSFVITDNLTNYILFNGIPARRDSDGVLGMYDLADSNPATAFHTNAGTGEFVAGPAVPIKIATTHYNETKFAPVENDLDDAVAAVDDVVTRTMFQAQAIDTIATSKQTRPDEGCTAKYCLLVEDEDGTPHWYPIAGANGVAHNLPAGYTELQYIESTGTQYIDLPTFANAANIDVTVDVVHTDGDNEQIFFAPASSVQFLYTSTNSWRVWRTGKPNKIIATADDRHLITIKTTSTGCEYYVDGQKNTDVPQDFFNSTELSGKRLSIGARRAENNVGYFWKGKIYSFKAECNGVVCINMVPARNSSGEIGMLDLADSNPATAFHTNAGTGTFTAGPDM